MDMQCGYWCERMVISRNSSPGSCSISWQLQCTSGERGQGRLLRRCGVSAEAGGRGGKGCMAWELEKLYTQRKWHAGCSGPESESNSILWEQWENIQGMSCHSSRLRIEAVVPRGHGKQCWVERNWYEQKTPALSVPALAHHQTSDNRLLLLVYQHEPITRPHYFLQSSFQFELKTMNVLCFSHNPA